MHQLNSLTCGVDLILGLASTLHASIDVSVIWRFIAREGFMDGSWLLKDVTDLLKKCFYLTLG